MVLDVADVFIGIVDGVLVFAGGDGEGQGGQEQCGELVHFGLSLRLTGVVTARTANNWERRKKTKKGRTTRPTGPYRFTPVPWQERPTVHAMRTPATYKATHCPNTGRGSFAVITGDMWAC